MRVVNARDLSYARITKEWVQRRKAAGVEVIVQDVWTGGYANNATLKAVAESNLRAIREGGCIPAIYTNAAPWRTPQLWYVESALNAGSELASVNLVVIDIEIAEGNTVINPTDVETFIKLWEDAGFTVWLYSGDWYVGFWKLQLGDANRVNFNRPYWYAAYDGVAQIGVPRHPLGPVVGKQYGWTDEDGATVDLNVFLWDTEVAQQEEDMPRLVRREGTNHVYVVTGAHLEGLISEEVAGVLQYDLSKVEVLPGDHPIWRLRTVNDNGPARDD